MLFFKLLMILHRQNINLISLLYCLGFSLMGKYSSYEAWGCRNTCCGLFYVSVQELIKCPAVHQLHHNYQLWHMFDMISNFSLNITGLLSIILLVSITVRPYLTCLSFWCLGGLQPVPARSVSEGRVHYTLIVCFSAILTYVDIFKFTPVATLQTISGNLETLIVYQCDNGKSHLKVWLPVCAASFALLIFPPLFSNLLWSFSVHSHCPPSSFQWNDSGRLAQHYTLYLAADNRQAVFRW